MKLENYLDVRQLKEHVTNGLVTANKHPQLPLVIFCYSREAVQQNIWDDITIKCRGLIVDDQGEIVARPFEKFFNISTSTQPETWLSNLPKEAPQVLEKLDGSLGILYRYEGYTGIASKGSFQSDHAFWATGFYQSHHKDDVWPVDYTPVFEMIVESIQTHVVQYGTGDELILTALVNNETGEEASYEDLYYWGTLNKFKVVEVFDKSVGDVVSEDRKNKEGYVLNWPRPGKQPLKVKVKHETFLALQKIAHAATPKNILEALSEGRETEVEDWASETNGEVGSYVRRWLVEFRGQYGRVLMAAAELTKHAEMRYQTRKEMAQFINQSAHRPYAPVAFMMLDRKSKDQVTRATWKIVQNIGEANVAAAIYADEDYEGDSEE